MSVSYTANHENTTSTRDISSFARIPLAMTEAYRWLLWRYEERGEKRTKVPYQVGGEKADSTDPTTWCVYGEALEAYQAGGFDGIGFALGDGWVGVDVDIHGGEIDEQTQQIIDEINSYTELSPNGGIHIICRDSILPPGRRRKGNIEMYQEGRYFTVTGQSYHSRPRPIAERTAELAALHARIFAEEPRPKTKAPPAAAVPDDQKIIDRIQTRDPQLWRGDASGYGSHSEADLALVGLIAFYVGDDPRRIDSLFRQSGLYREKWDRADYREATIARALAGKSEFYDWSKPAIHVAPAPSQPADERLAVIAQHLTDIGNAARFAIREKDRLRYCYPLGQWFAFNGQLWHPDQCGIALQRGKEMALSIFREAANEQDDVKREKLAKHALATQKKDRIMAAIELAKPDLAVLPDELDADPLLLNVANGTIDLRTGKLHPHRREDYLTKITNASFDPSAKCPVFQIFTGRIFRSNPALVPYLKRVMGYGATGLNIEQVLFFLWGNGANGKTTLLDAVGYTLGGYAGKADRELLAANDAHPTNIADLAGMRMAMLSETNEGRKIDEGKLKDLVGETRLKARKMKKDFTEFRATHKIFLCSNHKPIVRGTDYGFWRRIRLVPFTETISDEEKDPRLLDKLKAEAAGILAWIVEGCMEWQRDGLGLPDEVKTATAGYRAEMDSIGVFLEECCLVGQRLQATAAELYAAYGDWCEDSGEHPLSQKRLGMQLTERRMVSDRCSYSGRKIWRGIGLKSPTGGAK